MQDLNEQQELLNLLDKQDKTIKTQQKQISSQSEQIQTLYSEKQKLSEALKQRNEDMQQVNAENLKLNEKIGLFSGADKVLKQNQKLILENDKLNQAISSTRAEANRTETQAKSVQRKAEAERDNYETKKKQLDKLIANKAKERTKSVETQLKDSYRNATIQTKLALAIPTLYSSLVTLFLLFKLKDFGMDCIHVLRDIWWFFSKPAGWLFNHVRVPFLHWLLPVVAVIVCLLILGAVILFIIMSIDVGDWQIWPDAVLMMIMFLVVLLTGNWLKSLLDVNLAWLIIALTGGYMAFKALDNRIC